MAWNDRAHYDSFYHLRGSPPAVEACRGTACFLARHANPRRWSAACSQERKIYCLGKCYAAPAATDVEAAPEMRVNSPRAVILERMVSGPVLTVDAYRRLQGYVALEKALGSRPEDIVRAIEVSQLRGRGGAAYPTGVKWRAVMEQPDRPKYVVANADEGDAGAYVDRMILERDPQTLFEGMAIAAHAVGASRGVIYLRSEYPQAQIVVARALEDARAEGILGGKPLGTGHAFDIEIIVGHGSYVCGEETSMLNAIEGKRPEVRARPPYPTEAGLFGKPTLVNNVETLANVPWILRNGPEAYATLGFSKSRGTKVLSLNSLFQRPGLYEVEFGISLRRIVEDLGGGLRTGTLKGVIFGGPLAGVIPPRLLDTRLGFEELAAIGGAVGHGGVLAFDEHISIPDLVHHVFEFGAFESCGKCTPCRLGSRRIEKIFARAVAGDKMDAESKTELTDIVEALRWTSLCGHGTGLAAFAESVFRHYAKELSLCFA